MTNNDWIINIENAVSRAVKVLGEDAVKYLFRRYDARSVYDLSSCFYTEVFADLEMMANDN